MATAEQLRPSLFTACCFYSVVFRLIFSIAHNRSSVIGYLLQKCTLGVTVDRIPVDFLNQRLKIRRQERRQGEETTLSIINHNFIMIRNKTAEFLQYERNELVQVSSHEAEREADGGFTEQ